MVAIQQNVPLEKYTTLQVGGPAVWFADITNEQELDQAVCYAQENNLPVFVIGGGSNVLVADEGVDALVLKMSIADEVTRELDETGVLVTAGAGMVFDALVSWTVAEGLWGLENLSHIPGSVGATPVQNVGAYGTEVKDVIDQVRVYNIEERKFEIFTAAECTFGYRDSFFKTAAGKQYIIVSVTYRLTTEASPQVTYRDLAERFAGQEVHLADIRQAVIEIRSKKFPNWHEVGTAGSFFKNPIIAREKFQALHKQYPEMPHYEVDSTTVKVPLGWILDKVLGLKGAGTNKVGQYQGQALVLINKGNATATEIATHAQSVVTQVQQETGIDVEWEVTRVGFDT